MRVSTANASQSDGRMFTVVVETFGVGHQRQAERRLNVPFDGLQLLMQTIPRKGRGVFAKRAIAMHTEIERVPVIVIPVEELIGTRGTSTSPQ